jgi:uncharacterized membrane protein
MHHAKSNAIAWAVHNLALAIAYGGPVFAKTALKPALREIPSETERGKLVACVWHHFSPVDLTAHVLFATTWLHGRKVLCEHGLSPHTARLVAMKDLFVLGAVATGIANVLVGKAMKREYPQGIPLTEGAEPAASAPKGAERYEHYFKVMGPLNKAFVVGAIAVSPAITISVLRTASHPLLSRLFES